MTRPIHILLLLVLCVLSACGKINGTGFGGTDQLTSSLDAAVVRLLAGLKRLADGEHPELVCDRRFPGPTTFVRANLNRVALDETLRQTVLSSLLQPSYRDAVRKARLKPTSDAREVTLNGVLKDALTLGLNVAVYRPRAEAMHFDELTALVAHEAGHVEGHGTDTEALQDARAACVLAYLNAIETPADKRNEVPQPELPYLLDEFVTDYTAPSLGPAWSRTYGNMGVSGGSARTVGNAQAAYEVAGLYVRDVRMKAVIDVSGTQDSSLVQLFARRIDDNNQYTASIVRTGTTVTATLLVKDDGQWFPLGSDTFTATRAEMLLEVKGNRLKLVYQGRTVADVTDNRVSGPGRVGMRALNAALENFLGEAP